jgi:hypothetical protein
VPVPVGDEGGGGGDGAGGSSVDGSMTITDSSAPMDSGGGGSGMDSGVDANVPITVKGRTAALDNSFTFYPLLAPQVSLKIFDATGKEFDVKSDDDGLFTVANVLPPYDVLVVPSGATANVFYQGLRGTSPVLPVTDSQTVAVGEDEFSATYSGTSTYQPPTVGTVALVMAAQTIARAHTTPGSIPGAAADGGFGGSDVVEWNHFGSETTATFDLYFLHDDSSPGIPPVNYYGFGSLTNVTLHTDGTPIIPTIPVTKPSSGLSSGLSKYTVPAAVTADERSVFVTNGPRVTIPLYDESTANTDFTMSTPGLNGMKLALCGSGHVAAASGTPSTTRGCKGGLALGAQNVTVPLLTIPTLTTPASNATNVSRTGTFTFDQVEGKQRYMVQIRSKTNGVSWTIFTMSKTVTIPSQGPKLDSSADYEWWVESFGPFDSIDDSLLEDEAFERHDVDRYRTTVTSNAFHTEL